MYLLIAVHSATALFNVGELMLTLASTKVLEYRRTRNIGRVRGSAVLITVDNASAILEILQRAAGVVAGCGCGGVCRCVRS